MAKRKRTKQQKQAKQDWRQIIILIIGIAAIILLIYFSGEQPPEVEEKVTNYTLEVVFENIQELDKNYVTEWKKEELGKYMVPITLIEPYVVDLKNLTTEVNSTYHDETALLFIEVRIAMLESQKWFQKALALGPKAIVNERSKCDDVDSLIKGRDYLNASLQAGHAFIKKLDTLLAKVDVKQPDIRDMIGVNMNKPRFYISPFGDIYKMVASNNIAIEFCQTE